MKLTYKVTDNTYQNIKEVLKVHFKMSDRLILKLKNMQKITLNNEVTYINHSISLNDVIECDLNYEEDNSNIIPNKMPLDIVYEDDSYIIINKPAGIPVHPSMNHYFDSLANGLRYYFDEIGFKKKIRLVNRLDKDTSGLVIFAKNEYIQEYLVRQMLSHEFVKKYIAIVNGHLEEKCGTINVPIARKENSIIERCVKENGENAITHFKVISNIEELNCENYNNIHNENVLQNFQNSNFDVVECTLETGRTHQIRVHFAHIGHPLLGDTLYGFPSDLISRQALHAYYVSFIHPITKKEVTYTAKLPNDMKKIVNL